MFFSRSLIFILLGIQLSFCPTPPRMVRYFDYNSTQVQAMESCRILLEKLGYEIKSYTKESFLIQTEATPIKRDIRRYDYELAMLIEDRIHIYIIAQKHIFKRGSETSIGGGRSITDIEMVDWLPYSLQQKIYLPIKNEFLKQGIYEIEELG